MGFGVWGLGFGVWGLGFGVRIYNFDTSDAKAICAIDKSTVGIVENDELLIIDLDMKAKKYYYFHHYSGDCECTSKGGLVIKTRKGHFRFDFLQ